MVAMTKRLRNFQVCFSDPCKTFYCGGEKVSGYILVEVNENTRVSAVKVQAVGCAKVEYAKGKQRCRQQAEYLRHEEVLLLPDQATGTAANPNPNPGGARSGDRYPGHLHPLPRSPPAGTVEL